MKRIALALALFLLCFKVMALSAAETQQWLEDIEYYVEQVKSKHIHPFHTLSEAEFDVRINRLKTELPRLSEVEVETLLMGITASIGDGHSNYFMMSGPHKHYPFRYKFFGGKLRIIASSKKHSDLVGRELISINDVKISELFALLRQYLPGVDNQFSEKARFEFYLTLEKLLRGLNLVVDGEPAIFITRSEKQDTSALVLPVSMRQFAKIKPRYSRLEPLLKFKDIKLQGIQLALINNDVAYFKFTQYPDFEDVLEKCMSIQKRLKRSKATKLVIDLRGNDGGSFYTGLAFSSCLQSLEQFDWMDGVAILTDEHTFSAAMSNTVQFKQIFNAKIIGQPTGGDPNSFSEGYRFELPNSKRRLSLSVRYYPFLEDATDAVYPDLPIPTSWADYKEGKDAVLLKALEHIAK